MWQYRTGNGAGTRAKIRKKSGAGAENKLFRLRNTVFDTNGSTRSNPYI